VITFAWPTPDEEEQARRFQVHKNYVSAIGQFLLETYEINQENGLSHWLTVKRTCPGFGGYND
jgi:hypothetical protein